MVREMSATEEVKKVDNPDGGRKKVKPPEDIDYDEGIQWTSEMTSHDRTVYLIHQFLQECGYTRTLQTLLEEVPSVRHRPQLIPRGGELLSIVEEHEYLAAMNAAAMSPAKPPSCKLLSDAPVAGFLEQDDGNYASEHSVSVLSGVHKGNVLCLRVAAATKPGTTCLISAAADRCVVCTLVPTTLGSSQEQKQLWSVNVKSPVLDVACCPVGNLLAAATMDGHCWIIDSVTGEVLQTLKAHDKYVVSVVWTRPNEFVTSSRDHTVRVWTGPVGGKGEFALRHTFDFDANVECLCVQTFADGSDPEMNSVVIASVRDDCWMHKLIIGPTTLSVERFFNMNGNDDDYVSFAVLAMSLDRDMGRLLCVNTDKDRLLLFDLGDGGKPVRALYGASNDDMSQPRHCWLMNSEHVASTSLDGNVYVWEVHSQKIVAKLRGHKRVVRDVVYDGCNNVIISASYDGTVRVWPSTQKRA